MDPAGKGGPGTAWGLIDGFVGWSATVAALHLGVFDALAELPDGLGASELAGLCGARPDRLDTLCGQLVGVGFLSVEDGRYRLSLDAPLRPGEAGYLGEMLSLSPGRAANWLGLADVVRGDDPVDPVDDDVEGFHAPLARATHGLQQAVAAALPEALDLDPGAALRLADLGSGGGAWSAALLAAVPRASALLLDRPGLLSVARDQLEREHLLDRARLVDWDHDPAGLPRLAGEGRARFDVVVLAHVLRHLPPRGARALVAAAEDLLRPGGTVVVADYLLEGTATSERAAAIDLITLVNARAWHLVSRPDLSSWLDEAGFEDAVDLGLSPIFSVVAARAPLAVEPPTRPRSER